MSTYIHFTDEQKAQARQTDLHVLMIGAAGVGKIACYKRRTC